MGLLFLRASRCVRLVVVRSTDVNVSPINRGLREKRGTPLSIHARDILACMCGVVRALSLGLLGPLVIAGALFPVFVPSAVAAPNASGVWKGDGVTFRITQAKGGSSMQVSSKRQ